MAGAEAEKLQAKWGTALGQAWAVGPHRLMVGDCTDPALVARLCAGVAPSCVFTDPPYGVAYRDKGEGSRDADWLARRQAGTWTPRFRPIEGDDLEGEKLSAFLVKAFSAMRAVAKPTAAWYVWHAAKTQRLFEDALNAVGYEVRSQLIWKKSRAGFNFSQYKCQHEPCFYAFRANSAPDWYGDLTQTTVLDVASEAAQDYLHPTQKPVELPVIALTNSTRKGDAVLDPFMGSGTTLVACHQMGRIGLGMDLDPAYVAVTLERLSILGVTPELLVAGPDRPPSEAGQAQP